MRSSPCRKSGAPRSAAGPAVPRRGVRIPEVRERAGRAWSMSRRLPEPRVAVCTPTRSACSAVVTAPGRTAASRCTRPTVTGEPSSNERAPEACDDPPMDRKRSAVSRSRGEPPDWTSARSRAAFSVSTAASTTTGAAGSAVSMTTGRPRRNSVCIRSRRMAAQREQRRHDMPRGCSLKVDSSSGCPCRLRLVGGCLVAAAGCEPTGPRPHRPPATGTMDVARSSLRDRHAVLLCRIVRPTDFFACHAPMSYAR